MPNNPSLLFLVLHPYKSSHFAYMSYLELNLDRTHDINYAVFVPSHYCQLVGLWTPHTHTSVLVNAFKRIQQRHIKQCRRYMECFTMKSGALSRGEQGQWPRATLYGSTFKDFLEVTAFPERHFPFQEIDRSTWIKSSGMRQWYITVRKSL